jgi:hypothetical protein
MKYGMTEELKHYVDTKLARQKEYLERFFCPFTGESLLSKSLSANVNPKRYFAELNNRVNAFMQYCKENFLSPVFMTVTLPSEYHPEKSVGRYHKRVSNPKWNGKSPREAMIDLSDMWRGFLDLRLLKRIKKVGGRVYMKTVEPHGSGVPHLHVMMWIPKPFIIPLQKLFKKYFSGRTTFKYKFDGDEGGAVAYIMKYLNKTFKHAQTDEMTDEAYWCAYYGIRRFTTSRTLPALKYFRRCNYDDRYKSYFDFSKAVFCNSLAICFDGDYIYRREWYDDDWWDDVVFLKHIDVKYKEPFNMLSVSLKKDRVKNAQNEPKTLYMLGDMVYLTPTPVFAKMGNFALYNEHKRLFDTYNPFIKFDMDRFLVCDREYMKRFSN